METGATAIYNSIFRELQMTLVYGPTLFFQSPKNPALLFHLNISYSIKLVYLLQSKSMKILLVIFTELSF